MDAPLGIEPRLPQSKCDVLPLDEGATGTATRNRTLLSGFGDRCIATKCFRDVASPAGFEPAPSRLEDACPVQLGDGELALRVGFEPTTCGFVDRRSIPLSYRKVVLPAGLEPATSRFGTSRAVQLRYGSVWSRWKVSNLRSPVPKTGALPTKLHLDDTVQPRTSVTFARKARCSVGVGVDRSS